MTFRRRSGVRGALRTLAKRSGRALEIADAFDLHTAACKAYVSRAITNWLTLDLRDAVDDLQRAEVRIQQSDDQWRRTSPAYRLPLTLLWLGRFSEARAATERAEGLCRTAVVRSDAAGVAAEHLMRAR